MDNNNPLAKISLIAITLICLLPVSENLLCQTPEATVSAEEVPLTYFHIGGGISIPGLFYSKDIDNALTEIYGGQ